MSFLEDVYAASTPRETKSDILDYFGTSRKAAEAIYKEGIVKNRKGDLVGVDSLMRRFQKRGGKSQGEQSPVYRTLGEKLPPIPPAGGYHVYGTIWVKYSEECVDREVDELITGKDAEALAQMAGEEMLQALSNQYQTGDITGKGPGACAEPELHVDPIEGELEDFLPTLRRGPVK